MSWGFTDDIPDNLSDAELQDPNGIIPTLVRANNDRFPYFGGLLIPVPAPGDRISAATFIRSLQLSVDTQSRGAGDPATLFDGTASLATWASIGAFYSASGIRTAGRRVCRSRQVTATSATMDVDGNAAAAGQRAWLIGEPQKSEWGKIVSFNGSQWVITPQDQPVDTLDSNADAPNHCAPGYAQQGDRFGGWLLREIRDSQKNVWIQLILNLDQVGNPLHRVVCSGASLVNGFRLHDARVTSDVHFDTESSAKTYVADRYAAATFPSSGFDAFGSFLYDNVFVGDPAAQTLLWYIFSAIQNRTVSDVEAWVAIRTSIEFIPKLTMTAAATADAVGTPFDVLVYQAAEDVGIVAGFVETRVYDDNGFGIGEGAYTLTSTTQSTLTSGTMSVFLPKMGDASKVPNWPPSPAANSGSAQGMVAKVQIAIKFAFERGNGYSAGGAAQVVPSCGVKYCKFTLTATATWDVDRGWSDAVISTDGDGNPIIGKGCADASEHVDDPPWVLTSCDGTTATWVKVIVDTGQVCTGDGSGCDASGINLDDVPDSTELPSEGCP